MKAGVAASRGRVLFGDTAIEYEVRRSARRKKTVQITLDDGIVRVAAPARLPDSKLQEIVLNRAPWIVSRLSASPAEAEPMRFVSGETLPYLGRDVLLVVEPSGVQSAAVRFDRWRFHVEAPQIADDGERREMVRRAVVEWYRARAAERLPKETDRWRARLGWDERPRILVRDQRSRWGSCASDGTIRFNWRLMMLEPSLIEYIVVHELAHRTVKNHSAEFWTLVARFLPDVQQRRRRLREAGKALPL